MVQVCRIRLGTGLDRLGSRAEDQIRLSEKGRQGRRDRHREDSQEGIGLVEGSWGVAVAGADAAAQREHCREIVAVAVGPVAHSLG
jgi:hypothetical protein